MQGKKRYVKLSGEQREALVAGHKTGKKATFRLRCQMILLSDQGRKIPDIANILGSNRQSVVKWFDRYKQFGLAGLHTAKGPGRPAIVRIDNRKEIDQIERIVEEHPQKLNFARERIETTLGKKMSQQTLRRLLKKTAGAGSASAAVHPSDPGRAGEGRHRDAGPAGVPGAAGAHRPALRRRERLQFAAHRTLRAVRRCDGYPSVSSGESAARRVAG